MFRRIFSVFLTLILFLFLFLSVLAEEEGCPHLYGGATLNEVGGIMPTESEWGKAPDLVCSLCGATVSAGAPIPPTAQTVTNETETGQDGPYSDPPKSPADTGSSGQDSPAAEQPVIEPTYQEPPAPPADIPQPVIPDSPQVPDSPPVPDPQTVSVSEPNPMQDALSEFRTGTGHIGETTGQSDSGSGVNPPDTSKLIPPEEERHSKPALTVEKGFSPIYPFRRVRMHPTTVVLPLAGIRIWPRPENESASPLSSWFSN